MKCKKTWFGYFNFIFGLIVTLGVLLSLIYLIFTFESTKSPLILSQYPILRLALFMILGVIVSASFLFVFYVFQKGRNRWIKDNRKLVFNNVVKILSDLASFVFLGAGLFLRIEKVLHFDLNELGSTSFDYNSSMRFFYDEKIGSLSLIARMYDAFIAFIYRFVGIKANAILVVNIVLFVFTAVFAWASIRKLSGEVAAACVIGAISLSEVCTAYVTCSAEENLLFFTCSLLVMCFVFLLSKIKLLKEIKALNIVVQLMILAITIIALPIALCIDEQNSFNSFGNWCFDESFRIFLPTKFVWLGLIVLLLILCAFFSFYFSKEDRISVPGSLLIVMYGFYLFNAGFWPKDFTILVFLFWLVGIGLDEFFFKVSFETQTDSSVFEYIAKSEEAETTETANEEPNGTTLSTYESPVKEETMKEEPVKEEPVKEEPVKEEPVKEEPVKEEPVKEEPVKEEPVKVEPEKKEIKYIENVLPMPKKHEKKKFDFRFEPDEDKMKFDIDISPDDDFDM